jgi:hypothetical protein
MQLTDQFKHSAEYYNELLGRIRRSEFDGIRRSEFDGIRQSEFNDHATNFVEALHSNPLYQSWRTWMDNQASSPWGHAGWGCGYFGIGPNLR